VEIDTKTMRCKEGICAQLNEFSVTTEIKKLTFADKCMEDADDKTQLRWFEETANPWNMGEPNNSNWRVSWHRGEAFNKHNKFWLVEQQAKETNNL